MFSGFQTNSFQRNSYQIVGTPVTPANNWLGGPMDEYWERIKRYRAEQEDLARKQAENDKLLAKKEAELQALEQERLDKLADEKLQLELVALLKEIHRIELENAELLKLLMFYRQDEEDILIILLSMPFMN